MKGRSIPGGRKWPPEPLGCSLPSRTWSNCPALLRDQGPLALVRVGLPDDLLAQVKTQIADADALWPDRQEGYLALWSATKRATQVVLLLAHFLAREEARHTRITDGDIGTSNETLDLILRCATKRAHPLLPTTLHEASLAFSRAPAAHSTQNL